MSTGPFCQSPRRPINPAGPETAPNAGFLIHENLRRRLTTTAAGVEVLFPTGDVAKGTGFDRYVVRATGLLTINPTDK